MDCQITPQGQAIFRVTLHHGPIEIVTNFYEEYNAVEKDGKFRRKLPNTDAELVGATQIEAFSDELEHFIDYLNNCPTIDELHVGYALKDRCMFHFFKHGRLIDMDLATYADTLLLIYDAWKGDKLDYNEGFNLRSTIIKKILSECDEFIFLTKYDAHGQPSLKNYDNNSTDMGILLGI